MGWKWRETEKWGDEENGTVINTKKHSGYRLHLK